MAKLEQLQSLLITLSILLVIMLTGCAENSNIINEKSVSTQIQEQKTKNEATTSNMKENKNSTEETSTQDFEKLGITIQLPKNINIKVQYAISEKEEKGVLVSWKYKEFNYTLWGNGSNKRIDAFPIAKTAVYIANNMR